MFTKINEARVKSDSGFEIFFDHSILTYSEDDRYIQIDIDHSPSTLIIYVNAIDKWEDNMDNILIDGSKKQEILKNICEALSFLKIKTKLIR